LAAHRDLYRDTEILVAAESVPRVALQTVQKYLNPDVVMYLSKAANGSGWEKPVTIARMGTSDEWLARLAELIMVSHDADHCPIIIFPENSIDYPQFAELRIKSFISATVFCEHETLGRLVACSASNESLLTLRHFALLEILSDTIGLRIHDLRTREHKERFLNRALHHINTPAHSVSEIARQLSSKKMSTEERDSWLRDLTDQTERLVRLSQQARDFSVLQRSSRPRLRVSLNQLVGEAVRRMNSLAVSNAVSIETELPLEIAEVLADEEALHLALQSVLENAIKFSPTGTSVKVSLEIDNKTFRINVVDQGPGVPESQRKLIFEELISIERGDVPESTGLGLTIAAVAVKDHEGEIGCLDAPGGRGTCFYITIPKLEAIGG
jgi:signal transduction histidine kinase